MAIAPPESHDTPLKQLLDNVDNGALQLPEFQRGWTWDDDRIRNIIASLSQGYPMGALMQLECGGDVKLKYRPFEGTDVKDANASFLVLDGQQRLTSLYRSLFSKKVVTTVDARKQPLERYYYLDIRKCLNPDEDRLDAIVSVPKNRIVTKGVGKEVVLDLSSLDRELEELCFPANKIFDEYDWLMPFIEHYGTQSEEFQLWKEFKSNVLDTMTGYVLPVIKLGKETPRDAVCKVFENVNTGGVSLTVFELVTASFATYDFDLRGNWDSVVRPRIWGESLDIATDVMRGIDATAFLTSMTLYSTFRSKKILNKGHTSCKKKDVLDLKFEDYQSNLNDLLDGFDMAREFLLGERIFRKRDLPYTTQVIPLAATCAYIGQDKFKLQANKNILRQWLWCGIFGEMYGGANETRYANDIEDLVDAIEGNPSLMRTVNSAYFQSIRLLGLQTRNSAAYKGVMALVFREDCRDFIDGEQMTMVKSMMTPPDIHHIFPQAYCQKVGLDKGKWNSIVNKTPLIYTTNRTIGGVAPSKYLPRVLKEGEIDEAELRARIESHLIDFDALAADDFDTYFIDRAKKLLDAIERAMGKAVPDRGSEETVKRFGEALV